MTNPGLDILDDMAGRALVPVPIEVLGHEPELHHEVPGEVLRLGLAPLFAPEAKQGGLIAAQDDPGVRAADKGPSS